VGDHDRFQREHEVDGREPERAENPVEGPVPAERGDEADGDHDRREHERDDRQRSQGASPRELEAREEVGGREPQGDAGDRRQRGLIRGEPDDPEPPVRTEQIARDRDRRLAREQQPGELTEVERVTEQLDEYGERGDAVDDDRLDQDRPDRVVERGDEHDARDDRERGQQAPTEAPGSARESATGCRRHRG